MRRGSIFVILFALVAIIIIGASQFLRAQPATELTVAVSPLAESWVRAAADSFNASNPLVNGTQRIQVRIQVVDDPVVWQDGTRPWSSQTHPDGWIPALAASVEYAVNARFPVEMVTPSLAKTPLVWGIFESRAAVVAGDDLTADWSRVQAVAEVSRWDQLPGGQTSWGFVKLIFGAPEQTAGGLGVLLDGAAAFYDDADVTANMLITADFHEWIEPILVSVPNFNTIGADPAAALARGPSAGEIALLPESQWLTNMNGILAREPVVLSYPRYTVLYEFPLALWSDTQTTDTVRQGVEAFGAWLAGETQQALTVDHGLRPAQAPIDAEAGLFAAAVPYGIQLDPDLTTVIQLPEREGIIRLLAWASSAR